MPRKKRIGKKEPGRITIRFDELTYKFYLKEAGQHRLDMSEYLRQMLMRGVIAANAMEIQEEFKCVAAEIQENLKSRDSAIPDEIALSLFTVEELLKKVICDKNIQDYYKAQNMAQAKFKQIKSNEPI